MSQRDREVLKKFQSETLTDLTPVPKPGSLPRLTAEAGYPSYDPIAFWNFFKTPLSFWVNLQGSPSFTYSCMLARRKTIYYDYSSSGWDEEAP